MGGEMSLYALPHSRSLLHMSERKCCFVLPGGVVIEMYCTWLIAELKITHILCKFGA